MARQTIEILTTRIGSHRQHTIRGARSAYWPSSPTGTYRRRSAGSAARRRINPHSVKSAVAAGHEIALHSWDHRSYNTMTPAAQSADMERTMTALERISGSKPVGHKTASWRYDAATHRIAQEMGLLWVMDEPGGDLPYFIAPDSFLPPLVQLPPSRWFDDYTLFVDQVSPARMAFETWRDDLDVLHDEGGLMCLTLHPFVSGRPGPSRALAWLLDHVIDLGDVWIARADDIARWWLRQAGDPRG